MSSIWHRNPDHPHDPGAPGPRGLIHLTITLALLYFSVSWLRDDPKFSGAVQLTAALRYVLAEGAIEATPESVFHAAANGLTATLDPFSAYMPAEELAYFEEETEGEYVGIGVEIKITGGVIVIVRVLPQTSASEALVQPGDRIVGIEDIPTAGFTLLRAIELMRGPEGSTVTVDLQSPSGQERRLILERRSVSVSPFPVHGISRAGSAYIRWTDFTEGSADHLAAMIEAMSVEAPIGLILDLRGNPGGLLDEAVSAAGIFLPPDALVCRLVDRAGMEEVEYRTSPSPASFKGPVVVVMDENAASASEVLAAALQESGRAIVVGRRSYGKGWVQNVFQFDDGSALRLSTGRYYTPLGHTFGDPSIRIPTDEAEIDSSWFAPSGLEPDSVVEAYPIGPWEEVLSQRGLFADFAIAHLEDWPTAELLDVLRAWCDSLQVVPHGLGTDLTESRLIADYSKDVASSDWERIVLSLDTAHYHDREVLFEREGPALLLCLWEQRMISTESPDEEELDQYISFDPDLAVARDFLEQLDRYDELVRRRQQEAPSAAVTTP